MGKITKLNSDTFLRVLALLISVSLCFWMMPLVFELEVHEIKVVYMIRTFTLVMITLIIIVPLILFSFEKPKKSK
ncbi:hypothetical protein [Pseudozobellia sp. WGM2]|uniref:hypothetical protein n=1 Tax=Pseudozobellia sp. WGM2 TaxID=2787625 RepID=UPI001ADF3C22|nr:hypothetical protein [Pseudozobellia sp. WGM2]